MSMGGIFSVPYKSPLNNGANTSKRTSSKNQRTPQNEELVKTPTAPKKIKRRLQQKSCPGTPKTPSFKLYGIKSPCRRRLLTEGACRYSFKSPKHQKIISSQSTTPGRSPRQLITNFEARIGKETVSEEDGMKDLESSPNAESVREAHRKFCMQSLIDKEDSTHGRLNKNTKQFSVYDLSLSPQSRRHIRSKRKAQVKKEKAKQHVLKVLRQTAVDLKELRKKHREILEQMTDINSSGHSKYKSPKHEPALRTSLDKRRLRAKVIPKFTVSVVGSQASTKGNAVSSRKSITSNNVEMCLDHPTQETVLTCSPLEE